MSAPPPPRESPTPGTRREIGLLVLGATGTGKSTLIRELMGGASGPDVGSPEGNKPHILECTSSRVSVDGVTFVLIDTPGFGPGTRAEAITPTIMAIKQCLDSHTSFNIHGILYTSPATARRVDDEEERNLNALRDICGKPFFPFTTVVMTMIPPDEAKAKRPQWKKSYQAKVPGCAVHFKPKDILAHYSVMNKMGDLGNKTPLLVTELRDGLDPSETKVIKGGWQVPAKSGKGRKDACCIII
ncbi:hypothetical protein QBC39DRAFT_432098 [Podospora conica]|nr:hypothetical protein QBC39DRAFT_432098 [Schizothecium conicum]